MVIYCEYCGKENSDDSKFCTRCGKKLPALSDDDLLSYFLVGLMFLK